MPKISLRIIDKDIPAGTISCGVNSIDEQIQNAYHKTLCKQGLAYNICVDGHLIGNCMIKFVNVYMDGEEYSVSGSEFPAYELSYIAIDKCMQRKGIGTQALQALIAWVKKLAKFLPIRYFLLDAFPDKMNWYIKAGFKEYPKRKDLRCPGTVPMKIDLIDLAAVKKYENSL